MSPTLKHKLVVFAFLRHSFLSVKATTNIQGHCGNWIYKDFWLAKVLL